MPEFVIREHADNSQYGCAFCMNWEGPFVDLGIKTPTTGEVYICLPNETRTGCFGQLLHMLDLPDHAGLLAERDRAAEEISELEKQLAKLKKQFQAKEFTMTAGELKTLIEA